MSAVTFEDILDRVGSKGRWQIFLFVVTSMSGFFNACHHLGSIFLAGVPNHWCSIPYADDNSDITLGANWTMQRVKDYAIPRSRDGLLDNGGYDGCHIYARNYTGVFEAPWSEADLGETSAGSMLTARCHSWIYDHRDFDSTVVTQWNLVCDSKPLASTVQATYMVGAFFGTFVFGYISDRFGRRTAILFAGVEFIVAPLLAAIPMHYVWFIAFRILTGMGAGGVFTATFVLMSEFSSPRIRDVLGIAYQIPFSLGTMLLAGLSYFVRHWTDLQLTIALLNMFVILYYWMIPESPRWLIVNERYDEALPILRRVAKFNGVVGVPDKDLMDMMKQYYKTEDAKRREKKRSQSSSLSIFVDLFRTSQMRKRILVSYFIWVAVSLCYYGLSFKAPSLGEDRHFIAFLSALIEIPSYALGCVIIRCLSRRTNTIGTFMIGGIACLSILLVPAGDVTASTVLALVGKFFIAITYAIVYLYTTEIFPTSNRSVALGTSSMCARFGSTGAPYIVDLLGGNLPMIIFGVSSCLAGFLSFMLPETKDRTLPETVSDVELSDATVECNSLSDLDSNGQQTNNEKNASSYNDFT